MASQPIANPSIDWSSRNLGQEYTTFMEMCKLMLLVHIKSVQIVNNSVIWYFGAVLKL